MTVFVCEDDDDILGLIKILLSYLDVEVIACQDAKLAMEILQSQPVNLIIMDYWIKNVKADRLISQIRQQATLKHTPIMLISAVDNLAAVAADLPVDALVQKPFDIHHFQSQVQSLLVKQTD